MKRIRTFIAIGLDAGVLRTIGKLIDQLAGEFGAVRWVARENIHLTLAFLGEVHELEIPGVCAAVAEAVRDQVDYALELVGVGAFPSLRKPRTIWVGTRAGTDHTKSLQERIAGQIEPLGYRREERPYSPHLTIGRVRGTRIPPAVGKKIGSLADWQAGVTGVDAVRVMRSELGPGGPVYTTLSVHELQE